MQIFSTKNTDISKIKRALVLKGIFSETTYVYVSYVPNFKSPPIPRPSPPQNAPLQSPLILGLKKNLF